MYCKSNSIYPKNIFLDLAPYYIENIGQEIPNLCIINYDIINCYYDTLIFYYYFCSNK